MIITTIPTAEQIEKENQFATIKSIYHGANYAITACLPSYTGNAAVDSVLSEAIAELFNLRLFASLDLKEAGLLR